MTTEVVKIDVRCMIDRDLPGVATIESFDNVCQWDESVFRETMRQRNAIAMVAECGDFVTGYMVYELQAKRVCLRRLAVHPGWRRMGIGGQLIDRLVSKGSFRRDRIVMNVHEANLDLQLFLRAEGFRAVAVAGELYVMVRMLPLERC